MFLDFRNTKIHYSLSGKGKKIVLLHGYLEDLTVWGEFANILSQHFEVLCLDLLGHGKSGVVNEISSMELQAEMVSHALNELNFDNSFLIGHSMGGYTALAFAEKYSEKLSGFCLFHSHPFADSPMASENRDREINLILSDKKNSLVQQSIPNMFAETNRELSEAKINQMIQQASAFSNEGIVAALKGMKQRPDRSQILRQSEIPFLYIWGKSDKFVVKETFDKIQFPAKAEILILENSGHCGFYEEMEISVNKIIEFVNRINC